MTTDTGTTVPDEVKTYTYGLKLNKVDLGTEEALKDSNIKFTIKVKSAVDSNLVGRYVKSDGTLVDAECKLSVTNGAITIKGLGAGTYTVVETDAPANYDKVQPFDFTITPNRDSDASGKSPVGAKYEINTSQKDQVIIGTRTMRRTTTSSRPRLAQLQTATVPSTSPLAIPSMSASRSPVSTA